MGPKLGIYRGSHRASPLHEQNLRLFSKKRMHEMQTPLQTPLKSHFYAVSERTTDRIFAPLKKIL